MPSRVPISMNKTTISALAGAAVLAFSASSSQALELLTDGTFESPLQTGDGNHINVVPDGWIVAETLAATSSDTSVSNLNRGVVTNGTGPTNGTSATPLGICPEDPTGQQSLDGANVTVFVSQTFTLGTASPLAISVDIGGRDSGSDAGAGSSWELLDSNGVVQASASGITPATGSWVQSATTTSILPSGTYRFVVNLLDPDMVDAATITNVPEPSTFAAAGLGAGLLGWMGFKRRRRS